MKYNKNDALSEMEGNTSPSGLGMASPSKISSRKSAQFSEVSIGLADFEADLLGLDGDAKKTGHEDKAREATIDFYRSM
jgi:hypothetical protein